MRRRACDGLGNGRRSAGRGASEADYPITALGLSADGKTLATADLLGVVRIWDVRTGARMQVENVGGGSGISFSPDGRTLAAATVSGVELGTFAPTGSSAGSIAIGT